MFDVGMSELIVIFVVALLVFGPKRLPELARALGKGLAEVKKSLNDAKRQVETEFKAIEGQQESGIGKGLADFKQTLEDVKKQVTTGYTDTMTSVNRMPVPKPDESSYEEAEEDIGEQIEEEKTKGEERKEEKKENKEKQENSEKDKKS